MRALERYLWAGAGTLLLLGCGPAGGDDAGAYVGDGGLDDAGGLSLLARSVEVGAGHACAFVEVEDGSTSVWCWGLNDVAQLGFEPELSADRCPTGRGDELPCQSTPRLTPLAADGVELELASTVTCVVGSSAACVGSALFGLGDGTHGSLAQSEPVTVALVGEVQQVAVGNGHACARVLGADAIVRVWCWGRNDSGQAGSDPATSIACDLGSMMSLACEPVPVEVSGLEGAIDIDVGLFHSCAALGDGSVRCWGLNQAGQLGNGSWDSGLTPHQEPVPVLGITTAQSVICGAYHTCAHMEDRSLECWGQSREGQTGTGLMGREICGGGFCTLSPTPIPLGNIERVSAFGYHTCAVADSDVFCWGDNSLGQLGLGRVDGPEDCHPNPMVSVPCSSTPMRVSLPGPATAVAAGFASTCALVGEQVHCWGDNSVGQLGRMASDVVSSPRVVEFLP